VCIRIVENINLRRIYYSEREYIPNSITTSDNDDQAGGARTERAPSDRKQRDVATPLLLVLARFAGARASDYRRRRYSNSLDTQPDESTARSAWRCCPGVASRRVADRHRCYCFVAAAVGSGTQSRYVVAAAAAAAAIRSLSKFLRRTRRRRRRRRFSFAFERNVHAVFPIE